MMKKSLFLLLAVLTALPATSCDDGNKNNNKVNNQNNVTVPVRADCAVLISHPATNETSARVVGSFNGWSVQDGWPMERNGYTWELRLSSNPADAATGARVLPPGEHAYKVVLNEHDWRLDPTNPYWIFDDSQQNANSLLLFPDCALPRIEETGSEVDWENKTLRLRFQVHRPGDGAAIDRVSQVAHAGELLLPSRLDYNPLSGAGTVTAEDVAPGKVRVRLTAEAGSGSASRRVPVWMERSPTGWEDQIMYSIFVDRFHNGDPSNDAPIAGLETQINWQGGDWKGITTKLREGFFEDLGITALWLSTPMDNPDDAHPGDCGRSFSGYHAYWPQSSRGTENQFGTAEDLKELVQEAHARGIRVLVDWAANHIFIEHELHRQHFGDPAWFNYPGSNNPDEFWKNKCGYLGWNEYALTCWFTEYLPDFNHRNQALLHVLIEDALWWADTFDLDGFRVDATKHIESNYLRLLRRALDREVAGRGAPFYMVGENFLYDYGIINEKIGPHELQGQFDFPLYGAIRAAVIPWGTDLAYLNSFVYNSFIDFQGITDLRWQVDGPTPNGTLMGNFLGNHDVERFSSVAAGQANGDGCQAFNQPLVPQPDEPTIYARLGVGFGFLLTVRGLPVIYYGDEFGLAGVKDPDNRRPMVFSDAQFSDAQKTLRDLVARLNHARIRYSALRTGKYDAFHGEPSCLAYLKSDGNGRLLVVLSGNAGCSASITMKDGYNLTDGTVLRDVLFGEHQVTINGGAVQMNLPAHQVRVFLPGD